MNNLKQYFTVDEEMKVQAQFPQAEEVQGSLERFLASLAAT